MDVLIVGFLLLNSAIAAARASKIPLTPRPPTNICETLKLISQNSAERDAIRAEVSMKALTITTNTMGVDLSDVQESPVRFDIYEPMGEPNRMSKTYYVMYISNKQEVAARSKWYSIVQMDAGSGGTSLVAQPRAEHLNTINACAAQVFEIKYRDMYNFQLIKHSRYGENTVLCAVSDESESHSNRLVARLTPESECINDTWTFF